MQLREKIKEQLKENEAFHDFCFERKFKDGTSEDLNVTIFKRKLPYDNGYSLYCIEKFKENDIMNKDYYYLCSIDNEYNIMYLTDYNRGRYYSNEHKIKTILEGIIDQKFVDLDTHETSELIDETNEKYKDYMMDADKIIEEEFESKKEEIMKEYKYKDYRKIGMEYYSESRTNSKPQCYPSINSNIISAIDAGKYKEYILDRFSKDYEEKYKKYFFYEQAKKDYEEEFNSNPMLQKNNKIKEIFENDAYQSFRIFHTMPDGNEREFSFKKGTQKYGNVLESIIQDNEIYNIPIDSINKIVYRKTILVNKDDYKLPPYDLEELAKKYAKCKHDPMYEQVIKAFNDNGNVMKVVIERDADLIKKASPKLLNDKDFILDVVDNHYNERTGWWWSRDTYASNFGQDLFKDRDFVNKIIKVLQKEKNKEKRSKIKIADLIDESIIDNDLVLDMLNCYEVTEATKIIPRYDICLTDDKILDKLKELNIRESCYSDVIKNVLPYIRDVNRLFELFNINIIGEKILQLDENILNDKEAVMTILNNAEQALPVSENYSKYGKFDSSLLEYYQEDKDVCRGIVKHLRYDNEVSGFLSLVSCDEDQVLDYAADNVLFVNHIKKNKDLYFAAVSDPEEIKEMSIDTNSQGDLYIYKFKLFNGEIQFRENYNRGCGLNIYIIDDKNREYLLNDSDYPDIVKNNIKDFIENTVGLKFKKDEVTKREFRKLFVYKKDRSEIKSFKWPSEEKTKEESR